MSQILVDPTRPTTHKARILAGRQQLLRIDTESAKPVGPELAARLAEALRAGLAEADAVLVADYAKGVLTRDSLPREIITAARAAGLPFCADPKPANMPLLHGASLISPNESEALEAAGLTNGQPAGAALPLPEGNALPPEVVEAGRTLSARLEAEAVFITRSEHGIAVFGRDGSMAEVPTARRDRFGRRSHRVRNAASTASALALSVGASFLEAAELANAAGGVVSRFVGVHGPTPAEVVAWLR